MCLGLALPCPRSGPRWATPRGRRGAHCAEVSAGARAPHGPAGRHPADTRAAAAPWPGAQGELRRPAARCGERPLPRSALHIPPLWPSPRRQLQALLRRRSGESTSRRLPQARSLPHSQARHSFASSIRAMLLRLPAARQPASRPAAARRSSGQAVRCLGSASCSSLTEQSRLKRPAGSSKCKGPHMPAQKRRHVLPHNAVVPMRFGSALQPVLPTALAPALPGAALGSPPSGCRGPCTPSLPSLVARVKCVLRPV